LLFFFLFQFTIRHELECWIGIWCRIRPDLFSVFKLPE
jgi:hypothetical protein